MKKIGTQESTRNFQGEDKQRQETSVDMMLKNLTEDALRQFYISPLGDQGSGALQTMAKKLAELDVKKPELNIQKRIEDALTSKDIGTALLQIINDLHLEL